MTTPTTEHLSNHARALLGGFFMSPRATLRFAMQQSQPSPEAEAALDELVRAGILEHARNDRTGARRYQLTTEAMSINRAPPGRTGGEQLAFIGKHGGFAMSVPIPGRGELSFHSPSDAVTE